jgi:cyanamide hydratase
MSNPAVEKYGWTAVPRKVEALLQQSQASGPAKPISISSIKLPDSALVKAIHEYAKKELAIETFNHSMRVYYYGIPLPQLFLSTIAYSNFRPSHPLSCFPLLV